MRQFTASALIISTLLILSFTPAYTKNLRITQTSLGNAPAVQTIQNGQDTIIRLGQEALVFHFNKGADQKCANGFDLNVSSLEGNATAHVNRCSGNTTVVQSGNPSNVIANQTGLIIGGGSIVVEINGNLSQHTNIVVGNGQGQQTNTEVVNEAGTVVVSNASNTNLNFEGELGDITVQILPGLVQITSENGFVLNITGELPPIETIKINGTHEQVIITLDQEGSLVNIQKFTHQLIHVSSPVCVPVSHVNFTYNYTYVISENSTNQYSFQNGTILSLDKLQGLLNNPSVNVNFGNGTQSNPQKVAYQFINGSVISAAHLQTLLNNPAINIKFPNGTQSNANSAQQVVYSFPNGTIVSEEQVQALIKNPNVNVQFNNGTQTNPPVVQNPTVVAYGSQISSAELLNILNQHRQGNTTNVTVPAPANTTAPVNATVPASVVVPATINATAVQNHINQTLTNVTSTIKTKAAEAVAGATSFIKNLRSIF